MAENTKEEPPAPKDLIDQLNASHQIALTLRRFCGRRGAAALYGVVIVALDSAIVFARQAQQQIDQQPKPEPEEVPNESP
jgi:hypothetical protein